MKGTLSVTPPSAAPGHHRFRSALGEHVLIVPFSRIYDLPPAASQALDAADPAMLEVLTTLGRPESREVSFDAVPLPAPQSVSLNVSSSCNLGCSYCYASQGDFGGLQSKSMSWEVARSALDALLERADPRHPITVGFLGGEPFVNARLIHRCVEHASSRGAEAGLDVRFSVTTNGTLLRDADLRLLREHRFAVTLSIDGGEGLHDARRPMMNGRGSSFQVLRQKVGPLIRDPGQCKIAARATVQAGDERLSERFQDILSLGVPEVGFAPLRVARGQSQFEEARWGSYLEQLIATSRSELDRAHAGKTLRLTNLAIALKQLHRGAASPYACGAGGGYFSVSAGGDWYACHRAIGQNDFRLGSSQGIDEVRREQFLRSRHVHAQTECSTCWARYLCSGGCHQEAPTRTGASCDFIRAWLEFCLTAYCELSAARPEHFDARSRTPAGD